MAKLDLDFAALQKTRQARVRLVADPVVGPREFSKAINAFLVSKACADLWSLLAPPASAPQKFGFRTLPHLSWLLKTLPLLYELVEVSPNTKVLSKTVIKALNMLVAENNMTIAKECKVEDVLDKCDVAIRMLLWWLRSIKTSSDLHAKMSRHCNQEEKLKLDMVLKKVSLPSHYIEEDEEGAASAILSCDGSEVQSPIAPVQAITQPCNILATSPLSSESMTVQRAVQVFCCILNDSPQQAVSMPVLGFSNPILSEALGFQPPKTSATTKVGKQKKSNAKIVKQIEPKKQVFVFLINFFFMTSIYMFCLFVLVP